MQADIDGTGQIVHLASHFDWTWKIDNLEEFCRAAGWELEPFPRGIGAQIGTGLRISDPTATAVYDPLVNGGHRLEREVLYTIVYLTDSMEPDTEQAQEILIDSYAEIAERISVELGRPTRPKWGSDLGLVWDLPGVAFVLSLESDQGYLSLTIANPEYHARQYLMLEEGAEDDPAPGAAAHPNSQTWSEFSKALALSLSRLPEEGILVVRADGPLNAKFTMRWFELGCTISKGEASYGSGEALEIRPLDLTSQGWTISNLEDRTFWRRSMRWPAPYVEYVEFADSLVSVLAEVFDVAEPSALRVDAWVDSYSCVPDITAFGDVEPISR